MAGTKEEDNAVLDSLEGLLDKNLEDVEDLPEYLDIVPKGFYKLKVERIEHKSVEVKNSEGDGKIKVPTIQFIYMILETMELADQAQEKVKDGSKFSETIFFLPRDLAKGAQVIKAKFKEVAATLGVNMVNELVGNRTTKGQLVGMEIAASVKTTKDPNKEDRYYHQVSNCKII
jgi:hypothetical protein